jgi:hypothetical protein
MWWAAVASGRSPVRSIPFHSIPLHQATKAEADADLLGLGELIPAPRKKAQSPADSFLPRRKEDGRQRRAAACSHGRRDLVEDAVRSGSVSVFFLVRVREEETHWRGGKRRAAEASLRS